MAAAPAAAVARGTTVEELRRQKSSPLVRRIAREHRVDLAQLRGSGLSGRVTKRDILAYLETHNGTSGRPTAVPATPAASMYAPAPAALAPAAAPAPPAARGITPYVGPGDRVENMTNIRQRTAENMVLSRHTNAHVTTVFEVDLSRVARLRAKHKDRFAQQGVKLTFLPFIAKAVVDALREHPLVNASVAGPGAGNQIVWHKNVNLGIAVALGEHGDDGLIVPVIKGADEKNFLGLCRAIDDMAGRARTRKLAIDEIQAGTFTITNPGTFGSLFGTPIIPPGQSAILGVGTITKRPVVVTDEDGVDSIAIRSMVLLAISFDHRLIDGAVADHFMAHVKRHLQSFQEAEM
jgi:2-oxoglutarate dehydrogenase E2 component (dihydrolipoamide succinyltransferase)